MELLKGNLYFITDEFFERVGDPYLKINYETSMRHLILRCGTKKQPCILQHAH